MPTASLPWFVTVSGSGTYAAPSAARSIAGSASAAAISTPWRIAIAAEPVATRSYVPGATATSKLHGPLADVASGPGYSRSMPASHSAPGCCIWPVTATVAEPAGSPKQ